MATNLLVLASDFSVSVFESALVHLDRSSQDTMTSNQSEPSGKIKGLVDIEKRRLLETIERRKVSPETKPDLSRQAQIELDKILSIARRRSSINPKATSLDFVQLRYAGF